LPEKAIRTVETLKTKPDQWLTVAAISETIQFRQITSAKMAKWVQVYLQGHLDTGRFDSTAATKASYVCKGAEGYRTLGCQIRSARKVQAVVQLFLDSAHRDIVFDLAEIQRHLDACEPGGIAAQQLLRLKNSLKRRGRIEGTEPENPKPQAPTPVATTPHRDNIGDIVLHEGAKYRVTAVDENGKATSGDEVE
jgi:hypothetical protein